MNKWLLRLLRQATKKVRPTLSALLIRALARRANSARNHHEFLNRAETFALSIGRSFQRKGWLGKMTLANFMKVVKKLAQICVFVVHAVSEASCQPKIRLLLWVWPSLHNNQVPEKIDLVLEEVKFYLLEWYWPPQRQRCDFILHPQSTGGAVSPMS